MGHFRFHQPGIFPITLNRQLSSLGQRKALLFSICVLACYWAVLIYYLRAQWSVYEQYNYGWAVPFLCLYLLWSKVESRKQKAEKGLCDSETTARRDDETTRQRTTDHGPRYYTRSGGPVVLWSLALCALLYAPTRFLHEANPIWRLTSWALVFEVIGLTLLFLRTTDHGPRTTFPICFFLVAVPWPSGVESFLTQWLMRLNVTTTVELLGLFGIPGIQHGNVIEVGTGVVGIDEACSGIRSLQATLMLALFFGEVYRLTVRRRLGLILLGFVLAFVFNVGRTLLLTGIASARGVGAVATWHDPAGVTILVACFLSLWLIARALQKAESRGGKVETLKSLGQGAEDGLQKSGAGVPSTFNSQRSTLNPQPAPPSSIIPPRPLFPLSRSLVVPLSLLAWLLFVEGGTELWYRYHEHSPAAAKQWSLNTENVGQNFRRVQIPPAIAGQFCADESIYGRWEDASGNSWQLYYFRWLPAHSLQKRVVIQLAKTHGPEKCPPAMGMELRSYLGIIKVPVAGMELAVQQYVFNAEGRPLHVFYGIYEDPSGSAELANRRRDSTSRVAAALAGSRNYGQRFLEVAVAGYERPDEARAAFAAEVQKLIKIQN